MAAAYLCSVDKDEIFTPWAARKFFLVHKEDLPKEAVRTTSDATRESYYQLLLHIYKRLVL